MYKDKILSFSKIIYLLNLIAVYGYSMYVTFINVNMQNYGVTDLSTINLIAGSAWAELAIHTAFHIVKSKAENVIKLAKSLDKEKITQTNLANAEAILSDDSAIVVPTEISTIMDGIDITNFDGDIANHQLTRGT